MSKYIFTKKKDIDNKFDTTNVTIECDAETLEDLFSAFEEFLLGCGFKFNGTIDIVNDDE